jgi:integrase/recombinase XerD
LGDKEFTRKNFVAFLAEGGKKGLKNSYLNNYIKLAKQIDRFLGTKELEGLRMLRETVSIPKEILTPQEIIQLANVYIPYRYEPNRLNARAKALILLLGTTGCRIDEALCLSPSDICDTPTYVVFRNTKNGEDRRVPISKEVCGYLRAIEQNGCIFTGWAGTKLSQQSVSSDLKIRARACGINKRVYAHLFRHSYITQMISQGIDWFELSTIVGHKDPSSTRVYYNQSLDRAERIIVQHPLLRPSLSFQKQVEMLKKEVNKIYNNTTARLDINEHKGEFVIRLRSVEGSVMT